MRRLKICWKHHKSTKGSILTRNKRLWKAKHIVKPGKEFTVM